MKGVIIVATARKGSSLYIANQILENTEEPRCEVVRLSDYKIGYCSGCLECDETHKCNICDDMTIVLNKVLEADVIIIVSPARYSLLSGDAKVFIDRLNPTAVSGDIEGKKFIAITVGQSDKEDEIDSVKIAVDSLASFAENAGMDVIGKYCVYNCYGPEDIFEKEEQVKEIVNDIIKQCNGNDD